jgi:selenocysteine-specific elongation factor
LERLYWLRMKSVIVGTAGHIDHGKTALVKALTGIDADRLQEEKRRGITIDIGFAHLDLTASNGEKLRLGFVDVPGHERFVRNMLAGIGGIDIVLLIIAADESIKPQTREHFDICRMLGVRRGITVLTKSDMVDAETLEVVRLEVEDFLRGSFLDTASSPIVSVSSLTGAGLDDLRRELEKAAATVAARNSHALARLPIDRVFSMKGFGTVVTGTLIAGTIRKEDELEVLPGGLRVRVRGVQVHDAPAEQSIAGQRTALNLAGATTEQLSRGMTLAAPDMLRASSRIDALVSLLPSAKPLKDGARVHFHAYTMETIAQIKLYGSQMLKPGSNQFAQLRLVDPALLLPGDRFILRQFSPVLTIGGGSVVENTPPKRVGNRDIHADLLGTLKDSDVALSLAARVTSQGVRGLNFAEITARTGLRTSEIQDLHSRMEAVAQIGDIVINRLALDILRKAILTALDAFHARNPLVAGMSKQELRGPFYNVQPQVFEHVLAELARQKVLVVSGEQVSLPGRGVVLKDEESQSKRIIEQAFASAGLKVPALQDVLAGLKLDKTRAQKIVTLLLRDKILIKVSADLVFHHSALEHLRKLISNYKKTSARIDVAQFKDMTGVSRKYAIPLLEYLDRERVTKRVGDSREIL